MKKTLLFLPAFAVASVVPSLGVETGLGFDSISQNGTLAGALTSDKYKRIWTYDVGINARLDIQNFYLLGKGLYRACLAVPYLYASTNGAVVAKTRGSRENGLDLSLSMGYGLDYGSWVFSPEIGFACQRLRVSPNVQLAVGAPFAGFQFDWFFTRHWRFNSYFNYSFLGARREDVPNNSAMTSTTRISMGSFSGPAGGFAFGYSYVEKWHFILGFNAKYVESTKKTWATPTPRTDANTTWLRLSSHIEITYNF